MKFKYKTKKLFKNISLCLLGLGAVGAIGVGATKIVEHVKDDTKALSLSYEVGGLNTSTGKYEDVEDRLYTKEKFCSIGLKSTLDFDNKINYQIFYYDILDNFVYATDVLSDGYSANAPTNGAYARIMIIPTDDDDKKISFVEKYSYGNQLNVEVSKKQNVNERYLSYDNKCLELVNLPSQLTFSIGSIKRDSNGVYKWDDSNTSLAITHSNLLNVFDYSSISFDVSKISGFNDSDAKKYYNFTIYSFDGVNVLNSKSVTTYGDIVTINFSDLNCKNLKSVLISAYFDSTSLNLSSESVRNSLPSIITLNK